MKLRLLVWGPQVSPRYLSLPATLTRHPEQSGGYKTPAQHLRDLHPYHLELSISQYSNITSLRTTCLFVASLLQ
jgi:hypothetical protein